MANIKVHVLNFHSIFTHIEIVLENMSVEPHQYYGVNRWEEPGCWNSYSYSYKNYIGEASSVYSFDIKEEPSKIAHNWHEYWHNSWGESAVLGKNCGHAAQWFLREFAQIPDPSFSNISFNHAILGIVWPSIIPLPVTLPGRIMSNVKFHVEARNNSKQAMQYSKLFLYMSLSLSVLTVSASIYGLIVATTVLSGAMAIAATSGCLLTGIASLSIFAQSYNALSAQNLSSKLNINDDEQEPAEDSLDLSAMG